jgi:hypothetical protein
VYDRLVAGRSGKIADVQLGITTPTRITDVQQRLSRRQVETEVTLSNKREDLIRSGYLRRPLARAVLPPPSSPADPVDTTVRGLLSNPRLSILTDPDRLLVEWDHNEEVQDTGTPRYTVDIESDLDGSLATARDPRLEYTGADDTPRVGSFAYAITIGTPGTDPFATNTVTITLNDTVANTSRFYNANFRYYRA